VLSKRRKKLQGILLPFFKNKKKPVKFYEVFRVRDGKMWWCYGLADLKTDHKAMGLAVTREWCSKGGAKWKDRNFIVVDERLMRRPYALLQTVLHETVHHLFPKAKEKDVEKAGCMLARAAVSVPIPGRKWVK
jgi:hypothetical protein